MSTWQGRRVIWYGVQFQEKELMRMEVEDENVGFYHLWLEEVTEGEGCASTDLERRRYSVLY